MAAVGLHKLNYKWHCSEKMRPCLIVLMAAGLISCASTEELFSNYDEAFCPAHGSEVVIASSPTTQEPIEKIVERVVIKEVPAAAARQLTWEPAVYYQSDSTGLSRTAKRTLDSNIILLQEFPRRLVAIRGFTDTHSSDSYNRELAQKRVAVVKQYLSKNGIADRRIVGASHGESIPLAGNQSGIADNINRRVELVLLDKDGRPVASHQPVVAGPSDQ